MPMSYSQDVIEALQNPKRVYTKMEFLRDDETTQFEITDDIIQNQSSINVNYQNGIRRTATIVVDNWNNIYESNRNRMYFNQKVRILQGVPFPDGEIHYFPQGIYYVQNTSRIYNPSERFATFELADKAFYFQNNIPGDRFEFRRELDPDIFSAVTSFLKQDKGNGNPFDCKPPVFDLSLYTKGSYMLIEEDKQINGKYSDVLDFIAYKAIASWGYDADGYFHLEDTNADVNDWQKPTLWDFNTSNSTISEMHFQDNQTEMYNHVIIYGAVVDGEWVHGEAIDDDPSSVMYYKAIGKRTYYECKNEIATNEQCQAQADYYLSKYKKLNQSVQITCSPLPHLRENCLITIQRDGVDDTRIPYIITSMTMPLSQTEQMSITASRVERPLQI